METARNGGNQMADDPRDISKALAGFGQDFAEGIKGAHRQMFQKLKDAGKVEEAKSKLRALILFNRSQNTINASLLYEVIALDLFGMKLRYCVRTESGSHYAKWDDEVVACRTSKGEQPTGTALFFAARADDVTRVQKSGGELWLSTVPRVGYYPVYVTGSQPQYTRNNWYQANAGSFRLGTAVASLGETSSSQPPPLQPPVHQKPFTSPI